MREAIARLPDNTINLHTDIVGVRFTDRQQALLQALPQNVIDHCFKLSPNTPVIDSTNVGINIDELSGRRREDVAWQIADLTTDFSFAELPSLTDETAWAFLHPDYPDAYGETIAANANLAILNGGNPETVHVITNALSKDVDRLSAMLLPTNKYYLHTDSLRLDNTVHTENWTGIADLGSASVTRFPVLSAITQAAEYLADMQGDLKLQESYLRYLQHAMTPVLKKQVAGFRSQDALGIYLRSVVNYASLLPVENTTGSGNEMGQAVKDRLSRRENLLGNMQVSIDRLDGFSPVSFPSENGANTDESGFEWPHTLDARKKTARARMSEWHTSIDKGTFSISTVKDVLSSIRFLQREDGSRLADHHGIISLHIIILARYFTGGQIMPLNILENSKNRLKLMDRLEANHTTEDETISEALREIKKKFAALDAYEKSKEINI